MDDERGTNPCRNIQLDWGKDGKAPSILQTASVEISRPCTLSPSMQSKLITPSIGFLRPESFGNGKITPLHPRGALSQRQNDRERPLLNSARQGRSNPRKIGATSGWATVRELIDCDLRSGVCYGKLPVADPSNVSRRRSRELLRVGRLSGGILQIVDPQALRQSRAF